MSECKIYALYDTRSPEEVKYIGSTCQELSIRLQQHKKDSLYKNNKRAKWMAANLEYVDIRLIEEILCSSRISRELYWISHFYKVNPLLLNSSLNCVTQYSQYTREKLRQSHIGKQRSKSHRKAISEALNRRVWKEETKIKISAKLKNKPKSELHKAKCRLAAVGHISAKRLKIVQCTMEGDMIKVWPSITHCARDLNLQRCNIIAQLKGRRNHVGNFTFKYLACFKSDEFGETPEMDNTEPSTNLND